MKGAGRREAASVRRILLWAARNEWLRERVPRLRFARRAVRRFMPGEDLSAALDAAETLAARGIGAVFTRLGENLVEITEAEAVAAHYHRVLDEAKARGLDAEVSVKLTQLGLDIDPEVTFQHCRALAEHAERIGAAFWVDMEGSAYTDVTLDIYQRLLAEHPRSGICLQAYLKRTVADVQRLLPMTPSIRLVKGAYDEPARIAFRSRAEVDASFQSLSLLIAERARGGGIRLVMASHDSALMERIASFGAAIGIPTGVFEVQMLYGIRAGELARLSGDGYPARTLIAYGEYWYPWYMRRLAERPANVVFALRQLLP
jgi:proline dehydrogenase